MAGADFLRGVDLVVRVVLFGVDVVDLLRVDAVDLLRVVVVLDFDVAVFDRLRVFDGAFGAGGAGALRTPAEAPAPAGISSGAALAVNEKSATSKRNPRGRIAPGRYVADGG